MTRVGVLVAQLIGVVVVAAAVAAVTHVVAGPVVAAAMVGVALVLRHGAESRLIGAQRRDSGQLTDAYDVWLPADRMGVGSALQLRFLPPSRGVWAAGMLCAAPARLEFIPSRERHADRAWCGRVHRVQVQGLLFQVSIVRAFGPDGSAQFVIQQPRSAVRAALAPYVPVVDDSTPAPE